MGKWPAKQFLKPDLKKSILFVVLVIVSLIFSVYTSGCFDYCPPDTGIVCAAVCSPTPLFYLPSALLIGSGNVAANIAVLSIVMLIFWYLVSCLVILCYSRTKKGKS